MLIRSLSWTLMVLLCLTDLVRAALGQPALKESQPSQLPQLGLTLRVINFAGIPRRTLGRAEGVTAALFRRFGVLVVWSYPEDDATSAVLPVVLPSQPIYHLRILKTRDHYTSSSLDRHSAGFSCNGARLINVFYDSVKETADAGYLPESLIFGIVVAHELGHTFLPPGYHSAHGLMCDRLTHRDWLEALCGTLTFSDSEKARVIENLMLRGTRSQP